MAFVSKNKRVSWLHNQSGSMLVYSTVVFSSMFLVGGAAVDFARHEQLRASMQYNLDRAVLAAASLKQTQDATAVVNSYMDTVFDLGEVTVNVDANTGSGYRAVSATASADLSTWFLRIAGIPEMEIKTASAAQEALQNIEVSMVLDISSSMLEDNKLDNLKTAAKDFVTQLYAGGDPDSVSISIVPFNSSVAPPAELLGQLNVDRVHDYTNCLDFDDADFSNPSISPTALLRQRVYTAAFETNFGDFTPSDPQYDWRSCSNDPGLAILPYETSELVAHTKIDSLVATGGTAGQVGMKWGSALLDPAFQPVVTGLIADSSISNAQAGRPVAYGESGTLKVILFLGDGANSNELRMPPQYRGPNGPVHEFVVEESGFLSATGPDINDPFGGFGGFGGFGCLFGGCGSTVTYTDPSYEYLCLNADYTCDYGPTGGTVSRYYLNDVNNSYWYYDFNNSSWIDSPSFFNLPATLVGYQSHDQLSWEEGWGLVPTGLWQSLTGDSDPQDELTNIHARIGAEGDAMMDNICTAAKDSGIVVYTIGFETDTTTSAKLQNCATSAGHYFDAAGTQISDVFSAIAASIQKLKLTQ